MDRALDLDITGEFQGPAFLAHVRAHTHTHTRAHTHTQITIIKVFKRKTSIPMGLTLGRNGDIIIQFLYFIESRSQSAVSPLFLLVY